MLLKFLPRLLVWSSMIVWFSSVYLFLQYDATRPTMPQPAQGRIYPSNNHGHVTYLTEREERYLDSLGIGAFSLFIGGLLIEYLRKPQTIKEIRAVVMRGLYGCVSPASWRALASKAGHYLTSISLRSAASLIAGRRRICLRSDKSVFDCRTRIEKTAGLATVGVLGSAKGNRVHLYLVRKGFHNSFSPNFYGKLTAQGSATIIDGKFKMHPLVTIFLTIWFTFLTVVGGRIEMLSIGSLLAGRPIENAYVGLFFPVALLLCGLVLLYWGKLLGRDDEAQIATFLHDKLKAEP